MTFVYNVLLCRTHGCVLFEQIGRFSNRDDLLAHSQSSLKGFWGDELCSIGDGAVLTSKCSNRIVLQRFHPLSIRVTIFRRSYFRIGWVV